MFYHKDELTVHITETNPPYYVLPIREYEMLCDEHDCDHSDPSLAPHFLETELAVGTHVALRQDAYERLLDRVLEWVFFLEMPRKLAKAKARLFNDGAMMVLRGSVLADDDSQVQQRYQELRKDLEADGIIARENGRLVFHQNYEFSNPSTAARVIEGTSVSGNVAWKNYRREAPSDYAPVNR